MVMLRENWISVRLLAPWYEATLGVCPVTEVCPARTTPQLPVRLLPHGCLAEPLPLRETQLDVVVDNIGRTILWSKTGHVRVRRDCCSRLPNQWRLADPRQPGQV